MYGLKWNKITVWQTLSLNQQTGKHSIWLRTGVRLPSPSLKSLSPTPWQQAGARGSSSSWTHHLLVLGCGSTSCTLHDHVGLGFFRHIIYIHVYPILPWKGPCPCKCPPPSYATISVKNVSYFNSSCKGPSPLLMKSQLIAHGPLDRRIQYMYMATELMAQRPGPTRPLLKLDGWWGATGASW